MERIWNTLIVLVLSACSFSIPAFAQVPGSCWHYGTGFGSPNQAGTFDCQPSSSFEWTCKVWNTSCPPAGAENETNPQGTCPTCNGGKPINFETGNTFIEENDIRIPGLAGGLTLTRTWNSKPSQHAPITGIFGPNWRSTYEERIFPETDGYVRYARADGSVWSFFGLNFLLL